MRLSRRDFVAGLGSAAVLPRASGAQAPELLTIALLHTASVESYVSSAEGFAAGLMEQGFVEAQNLAIEYRFANGRRDQLPMLAAELADRPVALIVAGGAAAAAAAKRASATTPVVVVTGADPVKLGLAASLEQPGGSITGATFPTRGLASNGLAFLRALVPQARTVGYLGEAERTFHDPAAAGATGELKREMLAAAASLGWQVATAEIAEDRDYEAAFAVFDKRRVGALVIAPSAVFASDVEDISSLAARYEIPTLFRRRADVVGGGLMSYGANQGDAWRLGGKQVGLVLKGEKPDGLPFAYSDTRELTINPTIARVLGLTIPPTLLALAEVVQ